MLTIISHGVHYGRVGLSDVTSYRQYSITDNDDPRSVGPVSVYAAVSFYITLDCNKVWMPEAYKLRSRFSDKDLIKLAALVDLSSNRETQVNWIMPIRQALPEMW